MKLATLRLEKAQLLGFETYADWSLQKTMIKIRIMFVISLMA